MEELNQKLNSIFPYLSSSSNNLYKAIGLE